jgi:arylsulfatase A-like enzyme
MAQLPAPSVRSVDFVLFSLWAGGLTGLVEVALLAVKKFYLGYLVKVGPDAAWMAPLADAALFLVPGAIAALLWAWRPHRVVLQIALSSLTFLSALGILLLESQVALYAKAIVAAGVAVQAGRLLAPRALVVRRVVRRSLPWLAAVVVLLGAGVQGWRWWTYRDRVAALSAPIAQRPNVLLIVLDTVRAKSLGLYGYGRPTTPNLERWLDRGVVFDRAIAPSSWTFPTHASLFTGRWPHEVSADWHTPLDARYPTLAEILRSQGYLTAGFAANLFYCTSEFGLARGFSYYEDYPVSSSQALVSTSIGRELISFSLNEDFAFRFRGWIGYEEIPGRKSATAVNDSFLRWLGRQDRSRPFFGFLNYLDAHQPFLPPSPFDVRFLAGPRGDPRHWWSRQWSDEAVQAEADSYDGAIAYLDHETGRLLDELQRRGVLDNTMVVITSDHGEHLGEHGYMRHGHTLYPEVLHVPLMVLLPKGQAAGVRVARPVSLRDIAATVLSVAGIDCGTTCLPGASLAPLWTTAEAADDAAPISPVFAEVKRGLRIPDRYPNAKVDLHALLSDGLHYIVSGSGHEELYDLASDPSASRNLAEAPEHAAVLQEFRARVALLRERSSSPASAAGGR